MSEATQWETACRRLAELTRSGQIKWSTRLDLSHERELEDDRTVGPIYLGNYAGKTIAVYEYRTKMFTDEDSWYWDSGVSIEFVDLVGQVHEVVLKCLWRWPEGPGGRALLEAIRYQSSEADEFLNQILSESPVG